MHRDLGKLHRDVEERRMRAMNKLRRHILYGYEKGSITPSGVVIIKRPKGIQNWYNTKELISKIEHNMGRLVDSCGRPYCPINGRWQLQVRGKHLNRVLKKRPHWKQMGRRIVDFS